MFLKFRLLAKSWSKSLLLLVGFTVLLSTIMLSPLSVQAQTSCQIYNPSLPDFGPSCLPIFREANLSRTGVTGAIVRIANYAIFIISALAVLMIVYAGFLMMTDGGKGERAAQGRKIVVNVIIGIVVAIASYTLVAFTTGFVTTLDISNTGN